MFLGTNIELCLNRVLSFPLFIGLGEEWGEYLTKRKVGEGRLYFLVVKLFIRVWFWCAESLDAQ